MNKRIKKLWVEALRSGKYEQGYNHLAPNGNKRCCLGVLCEIAVSEGVISRTKTQFEGISDFVYEGRSSELPQKVIKWAELPMVNLSSAFVLVPVVGRSNRTLATLNDSGEANFHKIANIIERRL